MKELALVIYFIYLTGHPGIGSPVVATESAQIQSFKPTVENVQVTSPVHVVDLINIERAKAGVSLLTPNSKLMASALAKCMDMAKRNYFAHIAPDGTTPWDFFLDADYRYYWAGENLARWYASDEDAMVGFMTSPTHRANIINSNYKEVGVGKCDVYIVQHFGSVQ